MAGAQILKFRSGDILLTVLVLAITAMLVVPLPTVLLDFLLVLNLSFSVIVLLVGLYMPNSLALLSFPTILLLTTLFRLALNVASSRLILSQGDAGTVIHSFGTFLIRGELLVGIVIFTIVTIVNFIVISKGAARVSEVAARFVLDALPGKQATIESELRSGLLSPEEARERRDDLRKESQLFGAMDGSMRFVQGDAIAGLCIIVTNIVGGLYRGLSQGMEMSDALQTYTILTVGDGLVSQIPALLISVCAGIVVTRVSSDDQSTLGRELSDQLFSKPLTIVASGVVLIVVGLLPGLPALPFVTVGLFLGAVGWWLSNAPVQTLPATLETPSSPLLLGAPSASKISPRIVDGAETILHLDVNTLHRLYRVQSGRWTSLVQQTREELFQETGLLIPDVKIIATDDLSASSFRLQTGGTVVAEERLLLDALLIEMHPESAPMAGVEVVRRATHPMNGSSVFWSYQSPYLRKVIEVGQIRSYDVFQYILLQLKRYFLEHPEELLSSAWVYGELKSLEQKFPGLLTEAFQRHFLSVPRLTEVCLELVRQGLSLKEFRPIVEAVASYCAQYGITAGDDRDVSISDLVDSIRIVRRKQLMHRWMSPRRTVKVFSLDPSVEDAFREAEVELLSQTISMNPEHMGKIRKSLENIYEPLRERGVLPVSILCASDVRFRVAVFLRSCRFPFAAIAIDELDSNVYLERVGTIGA